MHEELTQVQSKVALENLLEQWSMICDPSKEVLRAVPLFAGLNDQELESIYAIARKRTYPKGSFIFFEGDPGDAIYLILTGEVDGRGPDAVPPREHVNRRRPWPHDHGERGRYRPT